jgi:hypothetical protein
MRDFHGPLQSRMSILQNFSYDDVSLISMLELWKKMNCNASHLQLTSFSCSSLVPMFFFRQQSCEKSRIMKNHAVLLKRIMAPRTQKRFQQQRFSAYYYEQRVRVLV